MSQPQHTVYVVDDEPAIRRALSRLLTAEGFGVERYGSAAEFLDGHDPRATGCVVLDVSMPGVDGLALQELLSQRDEGLPIVFLTGRGDIPMSVRAMKRGAVDFLTKPVDSPALIDAVRRAIERGRHDRQTRIESDATVRRMGELTRRERQVMDRVVAGKLNKQIAAELGTVEKTIKVHRAAVMRKMRADSLADLVRMAERLVVPPQSTKSADASAGIGPRSNVIGADRP